MLPFSDQLGEAPTPTYQFGVKECNMKGRWLKIDSDMSIVKVKCFSEAPKHTSQKILVELR